LKKPFRRVSSINNQKSTVSNVFFMRYLVRACVKPGRQQDLLHAIENETLGQGSVAEGEYLRNMSEARLCDDESVRWVEICYCPTPLQEERPYWEKYFDLTRVKDAHDRRKCRDENGSEPWACDHCDCTVRLEKKLAVTGKSFRDAIGKDADTTSSGLLLTAVPQALTPTLASLAQPPAD
jgi:hypothetical protein